MQAVVKSKWDAFLDAYLAYLSDPTPEKEAEMEQLGRELQGLDPNFSYNEFRRKVSSEDR